MYCRSSQGDFWSLKRRRTRGRSKEPYRLRVVGHSLGGAALLIYLVTSRLQKRPHRIYRLILLTPAGFLQKAPLVTTSPLPFLYHFHKGCRSQDTANISRVRTHVWSELDSMLSGHAMQFESKKPSAPSCLEAIVKQPVPKIHKAIALRSLPGTLCLLGWVCLNSLKRAYFSILCAWIACDILKKTANKSPVSPSRRFSSLQSFCSCMPNSLPLFFAGCLSFHLVPACHYVAEQPIATW